MRRVSARQLRVREVDSLCRDVAMTLGGKFAVHDEAGERYHWRGPCEWCGKTHVLFAAHVFPKGQYASMRHVPDNVVPLCWRCHHVRWHGGLESGWEWFRGKFPERAARLEELAKAKKKVNLDEARDALQVQLQALTRGRGIVHEPEDAVEEGGS